eukprot:CAMPEP_0180067712 /NCGR_PEP_ID=MMETSP0985-20121206/10010_1 /TAXON_ID=483367 /ORGANISM="non described non described, Strain CCMP 2436" /LENGTH=111 /DNA_ID=CAMNT_0021998397 /DNA_START=942 /DNA_END=1274 /DNA_ORIENTATION=-
MKKRAEPLLRRRISNLNAKLRMLRVAEEAYALLVLRDVDPTWPVLQPKKRSSLEDETRGGPCGTARGAARRGVRMRSASAGGPPTPTRTSSARRSSASGCAVTFFGLSSSP